MLSYDPSYSKDGNSYTFCSAQTMYRIGVKSNIKKNDVITVSGKITNITGNNFRISVVYNDGSSKLITPYSGTELDTEVNLTKTTTMTNDVNFIRFDWSTSGNFKISDFQIEVNDTVTE